MSAWDKWHWLRCPDCGNHRYELTFGTTEEVLEARHRKVDQHGDCVQIRKGRCRCGNVWLWYMTYDDDHR